MTPTKNGIDQPRHKNNPWKNREFKISSFIDIDCDDQYCDRI